jgi:hypothetical protein
MASSKKTPPPADYDPTAPLTDAEVKRLRPAAKAFAERDIAMPKPIVRPKPDKSTD